MRLRDILLAAAAAVVSACGGGGDLLLPGAGDPATVTVIQGDQQNGRVGQALTQPLVASVTDGSGRPVAGATVAFVFTDGGAGAVANPDTTVTNSDGTASAEIVLGTEPGTLHGEVRALGSDGSPSAKATFTLTAVSADANGIRAVSGDGQSATVGSALPNPLVVEVADAFGNPISGVTVTWTIEGGGSVSAATSTTGADGQTSVTRTLGPTAGTQRTLASVDGLAGSPVTFVHTATSGSAQGVTILAGNNQSGPVSTELPQDLVVAVLDADHNPVPGVAVTWVVRTGGGSVTPSTSTTDAEGKVTATWTLGSTPGSNTLSAVVSGIGVAEFSATAIAGAPARLSIQTQPSSSATSGVPLGTQPVIQLLDASGNEAHQSGVEVRAAIASGGGTLGGTTSQRTDANGRATFTDLVLRGTPGTRTLRFSATGFASVTSSQIVLAAAPTATQITADDPDPSDAGALVTVRFTVTSTAGTPTGSVQVHDGAASCSGALSNGKGSCTLRLTETGDRTLTADYQTSGGFAASSDTEPHRVNVPPPPTLAIERQPGSPAFLGQPLDPQPIVRLKAPDGSDLKLAGVAVSAALATGGGTLGGTMTQQTDANGRAVFTDLVITGDAGLRTIGFTASGYTSVTSASIDVRIPPPDAGTSDVSADPGTISAGQGSSTITVVVRDKTGAALAGRTVTLSTGADYTVDPASATTGSDGVATFTFTSSVPGTYTIDATSDNVTLGSATITVDPVPTTTTITSDAPDPSPERTSIQVAFSVTAMLGTPTGDVTVGSDLEKSTCTASVAVGACSLELKALGTHTLTARYRGTGLFADSSGSTTHEVVDGGHGHGG